MNASESPSATVKTLARWLGVRGDTLTGAVYAPSDPAHRFTVEFMEQTPAGMKLIARTIASRKWPSNEDIPKGYAFQFDVPDDWIDGNEHFPIFRVVENGKLFPKKSVTFVQKPSTSFSAESPHKSLTDMLDFLRSRGSRPVLLLVTHETSLSGAPIVALNVLKQFKATKDWTCVTLSLASHITALDDQFREASDCLAIINGWDRSIRKQATDILLRELPQIAALGPMFAVVSSISSGWISPVLGRCKISSVWLIHEYAKFFEREFMDEAFEGCTQLVFPSDNVRGGYLQVADPVPAWHELCRRAVVRPQGIWWREKAPPGSLVNQPELRAKFRAEHSIPYSAFVVLGCGAVIARKGVDWFIALAHLLKSSGEAGDVHFIWVGGIGTDEYGCSISDDLERLGMLEQGVHFPGEMRDLEAVYAASDLFLMCSRDDPYPNVVLEALGRGIPLLGFDRGQGTSELIRSHGVGTLVPYRNMPATITAILRYRDDVDLRKAHGECGRRAILEKFAFEDYAADLARLVEACETRSPDPKTERQST